MRIKEVLTHETSTLKPLSPQQSRIKSLQQNVERSRQQLNTERERQRQQREVERRRKAQQRLSAAT
jgi:hypothetical protein